MINFPLGDLILWKCTVWIWLLYSQWRGKADLEKYILYHEKFSCMHTLHLTGTYYNLL